MRPFDTKIKTLQREMRLEAGAGYGNPVQPLARM